MFDSLIHGIGMLGQPRIRSVFDETGTPDTGYEEHGPYHCEDCIHKTAKDEPFCVHPKVIADPKLQDRLVQINNRPVIKVNLQRGCCKFVNQPLEGGPEDQDNEKESSYGENE